MIKIKRKSFYNPSKCPMHEKGFYIFNLKYACFTGHVRNDRHCA